jgi:hypothetical protein
VVSIAGDEVEKFSLSGILGSRQKFFRLIGILSPTRTPTYTYSPPLQRWLSHTQYATTTPFSFTKNLILLKNFSGAVGRTAYILIRVTGKSAECFSRGIGIVGDTLAYRLIGVTGKGAEYFSRSVGVLAT